MAAVNFTPISLYYSTTASAVPSAGNLVAGELALNTVDEKLYFKNSAGVVKLLASNAVTAPVTTISFGSTGLTPATATSGAVTVAGTLAVANGGTGQTTAGAAFNALSPITTAGDLILGNGTNSATRLAIGANGYLLTSNGTTASWQAAPAGGVTTFSAGTTGLTPNTATTGAITLAGTLATTNGGTGLTSFTSGGVVYASSTSALATGSQFAFNGTGVTIGNPTFGPYTNLAGNLIQAKTGGGVAYLTLGNGDSANNTSYVGGASSFLLFGSVTDAGVVTERMRLTASGGLVVGTTTDPGAGIIADANGNVRTIPQSGSAKTSSYTLATTDIGEYILLGASGAVVIPDATFATGDVVSIFNNTASTATITCTITTAYIAGTFTDKATMTLAAAGVATVLFITGTTCVVSGNVT